jgi:hypothetical protein
MCATVSRLRDGRMPPSTVDSDKAVPKRCDRAGAISSKPVSGPFSQGDPTIARIVYGLVGDRNAATCHEAFSVTKISWPQAGATCRHFRTTVGMLSWLGRL